MTTSLTPAARRDLAALAAGATIQIRYGPYAQLLAAGYITGPHESYVITDAGREAAK